MTLWVYALTGSTARVSAAGLSGERLRIVREGPIAAIVGEPVRMHRPTPEDLRRYDRIIRSLWSRLPAVLPARFGTRFPDADELRFVLRARGPSLGTALKHVRDRAQMTVRVVAQRSAAAPEGAGPRAKSGTAYLRARAARAARERRLPVFDPVRREVQRWVRDERIEKRERIATVYHLVPRASADAYRRAIGRAAAAAGLKIAVSGPWPPYAFVDGWSS